MAEETKQSEVTYISRYRALKIVVTPGYSKEVDGRRVSTPGTHIRFEDGQYKTDDAEMIAFIEARPEFQKGMIQRVPDDIEDLNAHQAEMAQNLEEREAAVAAREAAIAAKEAEITDAEAGKAPAGNAEGAGTGEGGDDDEGEDDGLEEMDRPALVEHLKTLKEENPEGLEEVNGNSKSEDIIAAIRKVKADQPAFDE